MICAVFVCFSGCASENDNAAVSTDGNSTDVGSYTYGKAAPIVININNKLYYCYQQPAAAPKEQEIIGTVKSMGAENVPLPTENEQVVYGYEHIVGQPYADTGTDILLSVNGNWCLCVPFSAE